MRLALTLCMLLISLAGFSQMTGGGGGGTAVKAKSSGNPNKWGSLQLGLAQPMGKFKNNSLNQPYIEAVGAKPGMYISYDANRYFSSTVGNPVMVGMSYATGVNWNNVNWQKWVAGSTTFESTPFVNVHFKLGPVATYKINDDMAVDGFFRIGLGVGISGTGTWAGGTSGSTDFYAETPGIAVAYGFGANYRWKSLLATMQINPQKYNFSYYLDNYSSSSSSSPTYKVPMSTFWLGIGYVIKKNQ